LRALLCKARSGEGVLNWKWEAKMTTQQAILDELSEGEMREVLDFAAFLKAKRGRDAIHKTAGVSGGAVCVGATRIAVWMLEAARREGLRDGDILTMYPDLSAEDLVSARNYVAHNGAEIEREIAENEAA
jgi:uncharacterized protein (DUF433 family)